MTVQSGGAVKGTAVDGNGFSCLDCLQCVAVDTLGDSDITVYHRQVCTAQGNTGHIGSSSILNFHVGIDEVDICDTGNRAAGPRTAVDHGQLCVINAFDGKSGNTGVAVEDSVCSSQGTVLLNNNTDRSLAISGVAAEDMGTARGSEGVGLSIIFTQVYTVQGHNSFAVNNFQFNVPGVIDDSIELIRAGQPSNSTGVIGDIQILGIAGVEAPLDPTVVLSQQGEDVSAGSGNIANSDNLSIADHATTGTSCLVVSRVVAGCIGDLFLGSSGKAVLEDDLCLLLISVITLGYIFLVI